MRELAVIVPTRGRPQAIAELWDAWMATTGTAARLIVVVNDDDPELFDYVHLPLWNTVPEELASYVIVPAGGGMVGALNRAAVEVAPYHAAVGFMGDDHRPRTDRWDEAVMTALSTTPVGIVSGPDGFRTDRLPTWCAMSSIIVNTLGYMAPPHLIHMYVDNAWQVLAEALGTYRFLPGVLVEHMHPVVGKAPMDDGYRRVNAPQVYLHDQTALRVWQERDLPAAVAKLGALL